MASLLSTIGDIWEDTEALCALVPFDRVYTGRIPETRLTKFPYVSILASAGAQVRRTDKTRYSIGPVSFHIWVDANRLESGEAIAKAVTDAYADRCWGLNDTDKVNDVLDGGEPVANQVDLPTVKAWEVIKLFMVYIQRDRVDHGESCCPDDIVPPGSEGSGSQFQSSSLAQSSA